MSPATPPPVDSLSIHPALEVWPLSDTTARQLVSSIKTHGFDLAHPILVWRNQIVDGRLRLDALNALGITPQWGVHLEELDDDLNDTDIWMTCARANGTRRHLSKSQRATIAVPYLPHFEAAARQRMLAGKTVNGAKGEAAELLGEQWGVSATMIRQARRLADEAPELFEQARVGQIAISAAIKQLDIAQGKREPDNPRVNFRYPEAERQRVEEVIDFYKEKGTSLTKRFLEFITQEHARIQAGVWDQAQQQRHVAAVLRELDPALAAQVTQESPTSDPPKESQSTSITNTSVPLNPPAELRGGRTEPPLNSAEGLPSAALEADEFNPFDSDEETPVEVESEHAARPTTESAMVDETRESAISDEQVQRLIERYNAVAEEWNRTRGVTWANYRQTMLDADMPLHEIVKTLCPTHDAGRIDFACKQILTNPGPDLLKLCKSQPTEQLLGRMVAAWKETPDEEAWFTALDAILELPAGPLLHGHLRTFSDLIRPQRTTGALLFLWRLEGYRTWNVFKEPDPPANSRGGPQAQPVESKAQAPSAPTTTAQVKLPKGEVAAGSVAMPRLHTSAPQTLSVRLDHDAPDALPFHTIMQEIAERRGHSFGTPAHTHVDDQPLSRPSQKYTHTPRSQPAESPPPPKPKPTTNHSPAHVETPREPGPSKNSDPLEEILASIPHPDVVDRWDSETLNRLSTEIAKHSNNGQIISDKAAQHAYDQWRAGMREGDPRSAQPALMSLSLTLRLKRRLGSTRDGNHASLFAALRLAGQQGASISGVLSTQVHTEAWIKLANDA